MVGMVKHKPKVDTSNTLDFNAYCDGYDKGSRYDGIYEPPRPATNPLRVFYKAGFDQAREHKRLGWRL